MIRSFKGVQAIGAASQPVFGTTLAAAATYSVDRYTGTNRPGTTTPPIPIVVGSTVGFKQNDNILVGLKENFTTANRALLDQGTIASIVDGTHMTVIGLTQNHAATGEYVVLDEVASYVQVQGVSLAGDAYLGTDSTVASNDPYVFDVLPILTPPAEQTYWHVSPTTGKADSYQTSQYWIAGTASDTFLARFHQN
jgi:hypothetical protein